MGGQPAPPPFLRPQSTPPDGEDFPTFRESFLRHFTGPEANAAARAFGVLLFEMVLEWNGTQPDEPEGYLRHDLRAALADLRALEGFLAYIGRGIEELEEDDAEDAPSFALAELAGELAPKVARIAATIEGALG